MDEVIDTTQELWAEIDDFPGYLVSCYGRVYNEHLGSYMRTSKTKQGIVKVGLTKEGRQHIRAVKVLVAKAFVGVPVRTNEWNTVVLLDGNQENLMSDNMMWRPRSFAWRYAHQFTKYYAYYDAGPVEEIMSGIVYPTIRDAGIATGDLFEDILFSHTNRDKTWPFGRMYRIRKEG